ncbi:MAG TPA: C-terminal binding protein [Tepidisphaeraceae bacterium]|jgi:D-3-phosphoglycerate dehydrogenase
MKVVITDLTFEKLDVEEQILADVELIRHRGGATHDLIELVRDADCVLTQFARVDAAVIVAMSKARAIVRYGIGVDNVDLDAARANGIPVCNIPDYCIGEVADHTLALILAITRAVVQNSNLIRSGAGGTRGGWALAVPIDTMRALRDMTTGVVGFGRIGREVCRRLRAFGANVLVFDPVVPAEQISAEGCTPATLETIFSESDLITLHCPSNPKTRGLINRQSIARMKRGVTLINVARGDLVDSTALTEALSNGQIGAAGLDVFAPEPIPADSPLLKMPNVILSAHVASVSTKAVRLMRETAATIALQAIRGEKPANIVNGVSEARRVPRPSNGRV